MQWQSSRHNLQENNLKNIKINLSKCLVSIFIFISLLQFITHHQSASATSLTLSIPSSALSLEVLPSQTEGGTFQKTTPANLTVKTGNVTGYTLKIQSVSHSGRLTNHSEALADDTGSLNSLPEAIPEHAFRSNVRYNNLWGFLPNKLNGTENTNFLPAPTSEPLTLDTTEEANPTAANNYQITLGAKIDSTVAAGQYSNTFQITALANELPPKPTMQDWDGCHTLPEHEIVELIDARDGNVYQITKLKDGKCWMIENLKIVDNTITAADSDVTEDYVIPASDLSQFDINSNGVNTKPNLEAAYLSADYGGYYTWQVATAGTGNAYTNKDENASSSICPKGWRLPTGGQQDDFYKMNQAYGGDTRTDSHLISKPIPGFLRAGMVSPNDGQMYHQEKYGYYWSSTATSSTGANTLYFYNEYTSPSARTHYRAFGYPVRCILHAKKYTITYHLNSGINGPSPNPQSGETYADSVQLDSAVPQRPLYQFAGWCDTPTSDNSCSGRAYQAGDPFPLNEAYTTQELYAMWENDDGGYMQNWQRCNELSVHQTAPVVDQRDNNVYVVAKLKDGQCWMAEDMRLGGAGLTNRILTPDNSDIARNFTLPESTGTWINQDNSNNLYFNPTFNAAFYSWYTATAGTGTRTAADSEQTVNHSVCPSGWKLPSKTEAERLVASYSSDEIRQAPANFGPASFCYAERGGSGPVICQPASNGGWYWTATGYRYGYSSQHGWAYAINMRNNDFAISQDHNYHGAPIRCLARP